MFPCNCAEIAAFNRMKKNTRGKKAAQHSNVDY